MNNKPQSVLLLTLEHTRWDLAKDLSFNSNYGLREGLQSNGITCLTVPIFASPGANFPKRSVFLKNIREVCSGNVFDQVWIDALHPEYERDLLDWLTTIAPVRVGFFWNSMTLCGDDKPGSLCEIAYTKRIAERLPLFTHVCVADEKDITFVEQNYNWIKPFWWPATAGPERFMSENPGVVSTGKVFSPWALSDGRLAWLNHPALAGLISYPQESVEHGTQLSSYFDEIHTIMEKLVDQPGNKQELLAKYLEGIGSIREKSFLLLREQMRQALAIVNLGSNAQFYQGGVTEGMASGRPVISCRYPDSPMAMNLFANNEEILLLTGDEPEELAEHSKRLKANPEEGVRIAANALKKVRACHTVEKRVTQFLEWMESGIVPDYYNASSSPAHKAATMRNPFQLSAEGAGYAKILSETLAAKFYNAGGRQMVDIGTLSYYINTNEELYILKEIFADGVYNFNFCAPTIVIDIGQNAAFTSLFFASSDMVYRVYGFEPFKATFDDAQDNIRLNARCRDKIKSFNFGLGATNGTVAAEYCFNYRGSVGIRPISSISWINDLQQEIHIEQIQIRKADEALKDIFDENKQYNIVMKIDCEGAEYDVIKLLDESGLLHKVKALIIEWHQLGPEALITHLNSCGLTTITLNPKSTSTGTIYAFR